MNGNWKALHWKVQYNNLLENQILMFRLTLKLSQHLNFWPNLSAPSMNGHLKKIRLNTFGGLEKLLTQNQVHKWVQRGSRYRQSLWEGFEQNVPVTIIKTLFSFSSGCNFMATEGSCESWTHDPWFFIQRALPLPSIINRLFLSISRN